METPGPIEYEIGSDDWDFDDEPCWLFTVTDYQLKPHTKKGPYEKAHSLPRVRPQ